MRGKGRQTENKEMPYITTSTSPMANLNFQTSTHTCRRNPENNMLTFIKLTLSLAGTVTLNEVNMHDLVGKSAIKTSNV